MAFIVGVDEAGRGPLAGPVAVGAVMATPKFAKNFLKGIKDSKKLTPEERELWFGLALEARRRGEIDFAVSLVSERVIDKRGIAYAIRLGIKRSLESIAADEDCQIFLDGGIKAPEKYPHQTTVIKGDEKIPIVSLASIHAKVVRDRRMVGLSRKFPGFGFHIHKGYGTALHRLAIMKFGPTKIHRISFMSSYLTKWAKM